MSSASSRRGKRTNVKSESTLVRRRLKGGQWYAVGADGTERRLPDKAPDWSQLEAMTDAEKLAAARSDPDAQPSTEAQLKRKRSVTFAKHVRWTIGLSQREFADASVSRSVHCAIGSRPLRARSAARSYLKVIARNPKAVRKALASRVVSGFPLPVRTAWPRFPTPPEPGARGAGGRGLPQRVGERVRLARPPGHVAQVALPGSGVSERYLAELERGAATPRWCCARSPKR